MIQIWQFFWLNCSVAATPNQAHTSSPVAPRGGWDDPIAPAICINALERMPRSGTEWCNSICQEISVGANPRGMVPSLLDKVPKRTCLTKSMPAFEVCRSRTGIILHDFELKVLLMFGDLCETSETPKSVFAGNGQNKGMIGGPLVYDFFFTVHFPKTTKNDIVCNTRNIFAKKHFLKRRNFPAKRRNFPAKRRNFFLGGSAWVW